MQEKLNYVTNYRLIENSRISIGELEIDIIKTSHDVADSVGYVVHGDGKNIVYITDTGYVNQKYYPLLLNCEVYILESNHDIEMLNHGPYSFQLRQRILGDKGHLSNYDCSRYLSSWIGERTKWIVLAHLSEENNTVVEQNVEQYEEQQIQQQEYIQQTTFEVKPSLWQRIKNSKFVKAIKAITRIRIVLDYSDALPEGRGENNQ